MVVFWQKTQSRRLPSSKRTPVLRWAVNAPRAISLGRRFFSRRLKFPDLGADPQKSPIESPENKGAKVKGTSDSIQMRRFGTTDLAIVLGLWSAMAVVLGGVLSEVMSDSETPRARAQSEAFALQLAQAQSSTQASAGGRGPASVVSNLKAGELGKDPWGRSYRYQVFADGVVVWSLGVDGKPDSEKAIERLVLGQEISAFRFQGDDVGFLKVAHKNP